MILNKDNYEFMMFELLEGNLNKEETSYILSEIEKDEFYKKEWVLMQHAVASPDQNLIMPEKELLLKPNKKVLLFHFTPFMKVAASLLLIGSLVFWYLNQNEKRTAAIQPEPINSTKNSVAQQDVISENNDTKPQFPVSNNMLPTKTTASYTNPELKSISYDSAPSAYRPELIILSPVSPDKITYTLTVNEASPNESITFKRPIYYSPNKYTQALNKAKEFKTTATMVLNDIPNLSLRLTPRFKDKKPSIGFELKGESIYANALIEIK